MLLAIGPRFISLQNYFSIFNHVSIPFSTDTKYYEVESKTNNLEQLSEPNEMKECIRPKKLRTLNNFSENSNMRLTLFLSFCPASWRMKPPGPVTDYIGVAWYPGTRYKKYAHRGYAGYQRRMEIPIETT